MQQLVVTWLVILTLLMGGCTKVIPDLEGNLVGYVRTLDEFAFFNNEEEGTSIVAKGNDYYRTSVDASGRFEFLHLPSGTYDLWISRPGYYSLKVPAVKHPGGGPTILGVTTERVRSFYIYRESETRILNLSVNGGLMVADFEFNTVPPGRMNLRVYYSDIENFSASEIKRTLGVYLTRKNDRYEAQLDFSTFPFTHGQKVWYRARIYNNDGSGMSNWFDFELNTTVYPNIGDESKEYSFIFP